MRKAAQARAISLNQPMVDAARRPEEQVTKDGNENTNGAAATQGQTSANTTNAPASNGQPSVEAAAAAAFPRQASDLVDEVLQVLKTTFPLLILSLETMVDQIHQKFKPPPEEDIYRHICLLLQEAIQVYVICFSFRGDRMTLTYIELHFENECARRRWFSCSSYSTNPFTPRPDYRRACKGKYLYCQWATRSQLTTPTERV